MFENERKFDKFYENMIKENAEEIENIRMKVQRKIWTVRFRMCLEVLCIIAIVWLTWSITGKILAKFQSISGISLELRIILKIIQILSLAIFPGSITLGIYYIYKIQIKFKNLIPAIRKKYAKLYKELVIEPMVNSFETCITYNSNVGLPSGSYEEAEFGDHLVYTDDVMYGNLNDVCKFIIADIVTISVEKYDNILEYVSESINDTSIYSNETQTANPQRKFGFEGVFVKFELPQPFHTELYLRKDANDKNLANKAMGAIMPFEDFRVELDYSNFEKIFDVYAYDKLKAIQIFTPSVMYELVKFYNEMGIEYEITIKENFVYLRFWTGGTFEPPILTNFSLDRDILYSYYEVLNFIFDLIHKLLKIISENSI